MIEENKQYETRGGEKAEVLKVIPPDKKHEDGNVVGIVWNDIGEFEMYTWFNDGSYYPYEESDFDLIPAKTPKEKYIEAQNALGLKPGDTVQIVKIPDSHELDGWYYQIKDFLEDCLKSCLGKEFKVQSIDEDRGIGVEGIDYFLPYQCLMKVKNSIKHETAAEMTIEEISKALGVKVKIVG